MNFPIGSYPKAIADYIVELSESTQTSIEMAGILSLGVLAGIYQRKYEVQVNNDYAEQLSLYTVAINEPAERKSAVLNALISPLQYFEKNYNRKHQKEIIFRTAQKCHLEKNLKHIQNDPESTPEDIGKACLDYDNFQVINLLRIIASDVTPESLQRLLDQQGGRITVSSTEGDVLESMNTSNISPYLKGFSGDEILVDRIGRVGEKIYKPAISMILAIQPHVLESFSANTRFRGKGLTARFLYAKCKSMLGSRKRNPEPISSQTKSAYFNFVYNELSKTQYFDGIKSISMSEEAEEIYWEHYELIESRLMCEWQHMKDYGGKNVGQMLRIAGLFHCVEELEPEIIPIRTETIKNSINVIEYFNSHAEKVFAEVKTSKKNSEAKTNQKVFDKESYLMEKIGSNSITLSQLFRKVHRKFDTQDTLMDTLQLIEKDGLITINKLKQPNGQKTITVAPN